MLIEDFTAIARTVAVRSKKYGRTICCGGFSRSRNELIRVYPLHVENGIRQWGQYRIAVGKRDNDVREESWKLDPTFAPQRLDKTKQVSTAVRYSHIEWLLRNHVAPSTQYLNEQKSSLGIIIPKEINGCEFREDDVEIEEYGENATNKRPYLSYVDEGGKHRLQVREIGCYEWLRKNWRDPYGMWKNKRLDDSEYRHVLFVGNMCHRRNVWLIIDLIQVKLELLRKHAPLLQIEELENQTGFSTAKRMRAMRIRASRVRQMPKR